MQSEQLFEILVVDDEPPICDLLVRLAQKEFPEARFVNTRSVQETYEYLDRPSTQLPQLVLLDIDLQQAKNGLDLLPELRKRFKARVPIIVLSSLKDEPTIQQAYEKGAVAYTRKPDDLSTWRNYVKMLKTYWHQVISLPTTSPE